jgi:putative PIN family toxin of toxin-antitoxin system
MQLVLDTNVVLDMLVFADPAAQPLAEGVRDGALHWLATSAMREELARVLAYPKLAARVAFHRGDAAAVLRDFDERARIVAAPDKASVTCGDPDDQKFIDLALAHCSFLISKDKAVLALRRRLAAREVRAAARWSELACDLSCRT